MEEQERWMDQARREAFEYYCYSKLVDDLEEKFVQLYKEGATPLDAVKETGDKYGLTPYTEWGRI